MPLNQPKTYSFVPKPVGPVKLSTRNSTRARLEAGGSYYRSKEYGEQANFIRLTIVEDLDLDTDEGLFVEQHMVFKPEEMVAVTGMAMPTHTLYSLDLAWNEEVWLRKIIDPVNGDRVVAEKYGIRWQIEDTTPANAQTLLASYGTVTPGRVLSVTNVFAVKVDFTLAGWPTGAVFKLRPRTHRTTLVPLVVTDPDTNMATTGWDPGALRASINADTASWIRMPARGTPADPNTPGSQPTTGEDVQDTGQDATFLTAFDPTQLKGGDGLPLAPTGLNTGPDRVLVHLNYSEKEDGSMGELNQVFEWVGSSAAVGSWQRYS